MHAGICGAMGVIGMPGVNAGAWGAVVLSEEGIKDGAAVSCAGTGGCIDFSVNGITCCIGDCFSGGV